jgi:hypothetical protein
VQLDAEDVARFSTMPEMLADGLRLANHFHQLGLGLKRASVAAGIAWMLTGMAHEIEQRVDLNPDGLGRPRIAQWLLAIVDVQLGAIEGLDTAGRDVIDELAAREIAAPAGVCSMREVADAS